MIPWLVAIPLASVFQTLLASQGMPWLATLAPLLATIAALVFIAVGYPIGIKGASWAVSAGAGTFLLGAVAACLIRRKNRHLPIGVRAV
jgi:O-antigen/teichoic acid export membrane protein